MDEIEHKSAAVCELRLLAADVLDVGLATDAPVSVILAALCEATAAVIVAGIACDRHSYVVAQCGKGIAAAIHDKTSAPARPGQDFVQ